ncbi:HVO_A0556 family zinc finger protein [Natronorubrum aibiense]|uniref:HVO_A0556 family zinc finger protein n=1 Tax=Natronorubrum aibiense TaxID=348826 RepID=UPI0029CA3A8A|nr:HVO_A0556 family zinc finger protein [Natronorubrum aibiense]
MTSSTTRSLQSERLFGTLEKRHCEFCDNGTLERDIYKGNNALVCSNCGVPTVQVWEE